MVSMPRFRAAVHAVALTLAVGVLPGATAEAAPPGSVQVSTYDVYGLALSAGRVTYYNRSQRKYPVLTRGITAGTPVTLGTPSQIGLSLASPSWEGAVPAVVPGTTSGNRTVWTEVTEHGCYENGIMCWVNEATPHLSRGAAVEHSFTPFSSAALSGTRALQRAGRSWFLYDLKTRRSTRLTLPPGSAQGVLLAPGTAVALAGDRLVTARSGVSSRLADDVIAVFIDYSIRVKNLANGGSMVVTPSPEDPPGALSYAAVSAWGDWVAWERRYQKNGTLTGRDCGIRNVRTKAPAITLDLCPRTLTSDGILAKDTANKKWTLQPYDGSPAELPIPYSATDISVDNGLVAWIDTDQKARLAPVDDPQSHRPRSLGNPLTSTAFTLGSSWTLDLVTTAPLTSCQVVITKSNGGIARTLPCRSERAAVGEVVARWNGRNAGGTLVPRGTYRWHVEASNGDGSLLGPDGGPVVPGGTVSRS